MAASFEAMLDLWSAALREGKARMRPLFKHPSVAESASAYIDGLLGPERRKTGWMRAEAAGDTGPWRQQAVLGRAAWDADALRDVVRDYVIEMLGAPDAGDRRNRVPEAGQVVLRRLPPVHRLGRQDHQLPDRRVRGLCLRARARLHRPAALPSEGLDERSRAPGGCACAGRGDVRHQAGDRDEDD